MLLLKLFLILLSNDSLGHLFLLSFLPFSLSFHSSFIPLFSYSSLLSYSKWIPTSFQWNAHVDSTLLEFRAPIQRFLLLLFLFLLRLRTCRAKEKKIGEEHFSFRIHTLRFHPPSFLFSISF